MNISNGPVSPANQAHRATNRCPKTAPFSRAAKYQISSKSHLFQKLENTLTSRWHHVTKMSPQMLILPISSPNKCHFLRKNEYSFIYIGLSIRREWNRRRYCTSWCSSSWVYITAARSSKNSCSPWKVKNTDKIKVYKKILARV